MSSEETRKDVRRLVVALDGVMDDFFDSCGHRDEEVEGLLKEMKEKYMKEEKECI